MKIAPGPATAPSRLRRLGKPFELELIHALRPKCRRALSSTARWSDCSGIGFAFAHVAQLCAERNGSV